MTLPREGRRAVIGVNVRTLPGGAVVAP